SFARREAFHPPFALRSVVALRTALYASHRAAGTRFFEFAGWEMPLQYAGIVEEHLAVRRAVGLFDVSHMGKIFIEGPTAHAFLNRLSANDIPAISGRARYTQLLRDDGTILDDVIVTCLAPDRFFLVCNAGPRTAVVEWLKAHAARDVALADRARRAGHPSTGRGLPPVGPRFRRTADAARGEQRVAREMGAAFHWSRGARGPTGMGRLSAARRRSDGGPRNPAARLPRGLPRVRRGPRHERDDVAEPARGDRARLRRQGTRHGGNVPRGRHPRDHASRARRVASVPLIRTTRSSFARPGETFIWSRLVW